jgi:dCMP deaminase
MRPNKLEYFMKLAEATAARSTCRRRKVGAVAVDQYDYIMSTGYNGVPSGYAHCIKHPCGGEEHETGEGLDTCLALHAEANLIAHCRNPMDIDTIFITTSPCMSCMKLIIATGCRHIVTKEEYSKEAVHFFNSAGGIITHIK